MFESRPLKFFSTVTKDDFKAFATLFAGRGVAVFANDLSQDAELRALVRKHAGMAVVDASLSGAHLPSLIDERPWLDGVFEAGHDTPHAGFVDQWIPSCLLGGDGTTELLASLRKEGRATHVVEPESLTALVPHADVVDSVSSSLWRRVTKAGRFLAFDYAFAGGVHVPTLTSFPWPGTDDQSTLTAARELQDWSSVAKRLGLADAQDETVAVAVSLDAVDRFVDAVRRFRPSVLRALLSDEPEDVRKSFYVAKRETAETRSGSDRELPSIALGDVVSSYAKSIVLRSPAVSIVGSVATQGESRNDLDFLVHGPFDEATRKAIEVRLGRALPPAISRRAQFHDESLGGPISDHCHVYDLALVPRKDANVTVRMAKGEPLHDSPHGPRKGVIQVHTRGRSAHIDFRVPVGDALVGWTLFAQRPGEAPATDTVDGARTLYSSFSPTRGNRFFKPIAGGAKLRAEPKKRHPKEWLDVEGEVFGEGEVGATSEQKGVVVAVARPQVELGLQTTDFAEYFLSGDKAWRGPLYFRRLVGGDSAEPVWVAWLGASALPSVLGRRAVEAGTMPPVGQSALPSALAVVTPQEFRYWNAKTPAEARRIRDALVASKFFTEANVRLVDGVPRRVVTKVFLDEPEAPELWEDPWGEPGTIWGGVEKIEKRGKRLFGAPTSKAQLAPRLVKLIPEHKTYVEPFCCTASVLFAKPRSQKEVLGDLDADVVHALKSCRDITKERLAKLRAMNWVGSDAQHRKLRHGATPKGDLERLYRFLYIKRFGYFGIGRGFDHSAAGKDKSSSVDRIEELSPRLKGVDIRQTDYEALVTKHDSPSTFFFFDPPYDKGRGTLGAFGQADDTTFDEERFVKVLKTIRGKFLVTYGTHGKLAQLAKDAGFRVRQFRSRSFTGRITGAGKKRWLTQVMISNYDPSKTATFEGEVEKDEVEKGVAIWGSPAEKRRVAEKLIQMFPKHNRYVEPFAGSATVFFTKDPVGFEILNDADKEIAEAFRLVKSATAQDLEAIGRLEWRSSKEVFDEVKKLKAKTNVEKLYRFMYLTHFSYKNDRRSFNAGHMGGVSKIAARASVFQARLRNAKICNEDATRIIDEYDSGSTFFFFDPPYAGYDAGVGEKSFDEDAFAERLKKIKGKFLLTYGSKGRLRQLVKEAGFFEKRLVTDRHIRNARGASPGSSLAQFIITNYDPSKVERHAPAETSKADDFTVDCGFDRGALFDPRPIDAAKGASERHRAAGRGPLLRAHKCSYAVDFPKTGKTNGPQCKAPATKAIIWADGRAFVPVCEKHVEPGMAMLRKKNGSWAEIVGTRKLPKDDEQGVAWWHSKNRGKGWHKKNYPSLYKSDGETDFAPDAALEKAGAGRITLFKTDEERYVLGVVLEPTDGKDGAELKPDSQKDIYSKSEVRQAAHRFMEEFRNVGLMHRTLVNGRVKILESFVVPEGTGGFKLTDPDGVVQKVQEGTWLLGLRIADDALWEQVKSGALGGLSIGGSARRVPSRT
jgi:site-specific DNA-adenine methylase